ncbi:MAG: hypothetical protein A3G25_12400 [Betaproteobacteria bacterium RIFCSPLOWO2_12_FULL_63_13]|nr:MAG: hypothetical protein A3G25_12400 [Betaproteobacteria bacterium RIFCSPLOWO2_12_FULL_63_13]
MIAIPVRYRRAERGRFVQKLQHAIPSVVVLGDGLTHLQHDPHGASLALGVAEVAVSALVIRSVIRGFRQLRATPSASPHAAHSSHGVDWIDLCLGAMLAVEAYAKFHATGHIARPTILLSVVMFSLGLGHGRLAAWADWKLQLRISDEGISVPGRFFRRLTLPWHEVAEIAIGPDTARVIATDGRDQAVDLADAQNADAIRSALLDARGRLNAPRTVS